MTRIVLHTRSGSRYQLDRENMRWSRDNPRDDRKESWMRSDVLLEPFPDVEVGFPMYLNVVDEGGKTTMLRTTPVVSIVSITGDET